MNDVATAGGWLGLLILGGFTFVTDWLKRRAQRRADAERGPIEGFTALTAQQTAWSDQLLDELAAVRAELATARSEIAALRLQIAGRVT